MLVLRGVTTALTRRVTAGRETVIRAAAAFPSYFLLNSISNERTQFASLDELRAATVHLGITLALEPINRVYSKYRFTWFDALAAVLFVGPPLLGFGLLGARVFRVWRTTSPRRADPA